VSGSAGAGGAGGRTGPGWAPERAQRTVPIA